jgi:uncharacterized protein YciI
MYFLMVCEHGKDVDALRDATRPAHRDWVASGGEGAARVLTGSAVWDESGRGIGNFGILETASEADAKAFAEGDPFFRAGIVTGYTLTRLADTFRADRIDPLTR